MTEETSKGPLLSRLKARVWAFVSMLGVLFSSLTHKRRTTRKSAPPMP